ncbi:MAG: hypothetical protein IJQ95_06700 [Paludibacteraceae bacterium]|nr:hypothetical protein [Paludibacteraceae bacterium]
MRIKCILFLMVAFSISVSAQNTHSKGNIYLDCSALTTSYTYTQLRGDIAGCLSQAGYTVVTSASEATWTVQVNGSIGKQQQSVIASKTWYFTEVIVSIMIDRGAYAKRIYETNLTQKGSHLTDFDDAALDAYKRITPQICETIVQQISQ